MSRGRIYQILAELARKGFAHEVPGPKRSFRPVAPDEALAGVIASRRARIAEEELLVERLVTELGRLGAAQDAGHPAVEILRRPERTDERFQQLQSDARSEILMFSRPPCVTDPENPTELRLLATGIRYACLYEWSSVEDPTQRRRIEAWMRAGEEARVVERLPTKMAVVDRRVAILSLASTEPAVPFTPVIVLDPGLAQTLALAFDRLWDRADPIITEEMRPHAAARIDDTTP